MKFKCKHTGQVYEFSSEQDIIDMLKHDEYSAVTEEPVVEKPVKQAKKTKGEEL